MAIEIVSLPIDSMVIFPSVFCMFTRGYPPQYPPIKSLKELKKNLQNPYEYP